MRPTHPSPGLRSRQRRRWLGLVLAWWLALPGSTGFADMLPSGLSVPSSVYGASYADVPVPDAGAAVASAITIGGAPAGAIVTSVQVAFDVLHEYPGDLAVWLVANNSAGQQRTKVLWNPGSRTETGLVATTVTTFNGAAANQNWQLVVQDTRTGDVGYLDQWSIRVSYLAPPALRLPGTNAETGYLIGTLTPSLQWNTAFGATRYRVRAQASPYDALSTVYEGTINGTAGTAATLPPGRLLHGGSYRWLATSITSAGVESGFGVPLFFATPPAGTLVTPTQIGPGNSGDNNRAFLPNAPPTLQWQSVVGATGYKVRVSEYPYDAANEVLAQSVGLATSFTPAAGALIPGVRYRWTVTALYPGGESTPWQGARYFEMSDPAAPQITSVVSANATRGSGFSYAITATNRPVSYGAVGLPEGLSVNVSTGAISGTPTLTGAFNVLVKAFNAVGGANRLIILDVRPPVPAITSTGSSSAVLGQPFSYQIVATENPTGYGAANLPAGLTLDPLSGLITGAVTNAGNSTVVLSATNSGGTGTKNLTLGVSSGPPYDTKLAPRGVHENQPIGTVVGNFNTLDGDPGQTFTYTLVAGAGADDNALFEIRAAEAALRTLAVFDYETRNTYSIRVRTTDSSGQFLDKQITVRVLNVIGETNNGIQLSDATVLENRPAGTLVGFLSAVDPDPGEMFSFAVVGGADALKFTVSGNRLVTAVPLDMETKRFYDVVLRVTDSGGSVLEESAVIEALDDTTEDFDGDGLTQAQEAAIGTSDLLADADGDGASDGLEVSAGTNPLDSAEFADGALVAWGFNTYGQINVPGMKFGVVQVAAGEYHSLALKSDGTVEAWGLNSSGQSTAPVGLSNVVEIATGTYHSLALKSDGTVVAWGYNNFGQTSVPAGLSSVVAVAAGYGHSLAVKSDGTVVAWGAGGPGVPQPPGGFDYGQSSVPAGLSGVVGVAAAADYSLALTWDGAVVAWGSNSSGASMVPASLNGVIKVAAGTNHVLALKSDGTVVAWGNNRFGQTSVPAGLSGVVAVAAATNHSLALKSDGTVVAWGLIDGVAINLPAGLTNCVAVAAGHAHSLAVRSLGTLTRFESESLLQARFGVSYTHQLVATGGGVIYLAMNLPPGLSLNSATGIISGTPSQSGFYSVRITAQNGAGRDVKFLRMNVGTSSPPTEVTLSNSVMFENRPVGTIVGVLNAVDPDPGDAFTYSVVGGTDFMKFAVAGNELRTAKVLDYEEKRVYEVVVRVTDSGGSAIEKLLRVDLLDDTAEDFDRDGLTQAQESAIGTSDLLWDTDGDGSGDGREVWMGTNPLNAAEFADGAVSAWGKNDYGQTKLPAFLAGVVEVAAGGYHSIALQSDGSVVCWGDNSYQQCNVPANLSGVAAVEAGLFHSLALMEDGRVVAWGRNSDRQCDVPANLNGVVGIAGGTTYSLALKSDGTVVMWGSGVSVPAALGGVVALAAKDHSLALRWDGSMAAWGPNQFGQCTLSANLNGVAGVSAGTRHSIIVKSDGTVEGWGSNDYGQSNVPSGLSGVVAVAAGESHTLALKVDGSVVGWGPNFYGELIFPTGLSGVVRLAAGPFFSLAVRSVNTPPKLQSELLLRASLGMPFSHQFAATGSGIAYSAMSLPPGLSLNSATAVVSGTPMQVGSYFIRVTAQNGAGRDVRIVRLNIGVSNPPTDLMLSSSTVLENRPAGSVVGVLSALDPEPGETFTFAITGGVDALKFTAVGNQLRTAAVLDMETKRFYDLVLRVTDGGGNALEKTLVIEALDDTTEDFDGDGLTQAQETVLGTSDLLADTDGDGSADGREVSAGTNPLNPAQYADGALIAGGENAEGQTNVPGFRAGVAEVAAGSSHSLALKADGTVTAWGKNDYGQSMVPAGLSGVQAIAAGTYHSLALKADGTVVAWGYPNAIGVPAGLSGVVAIAAGTSHSLALKSDGMVVAWGDNVFGQCAVPSNLSGVVSVAAGNWHSLALTWDGTVVAWGDNTYGQSAVPSGLSGVVAIACGYLHSLALKSDGTVVEWGQNDFQQNTVPVGLSSVLAIAAGLRHSLALKSDGTVVGWGGTDQYGERTVLSGYTGMVALAAGRYFSLGIRSMGLPPKFQSVPLLQAGLGASFSHPLVATGSGVIYSAMNLPPGLSLNPATGIISGTATQTGTTFVRFSATNSAGRDVRIMRFNVGSGSPPTAIGLTSNVVEEDVPVGTVVAHLLVQYAGGVAGAGKGSSVAPGVSFNFVAGPGDANNGLFAIVGDALVTAAPLDYENVNALHVRVRATDAGANVIDQEITIQVLDVVEGETLANWKVRNNISNLGQNTTADGLTALHKYAFGLDPTKPTALPVQAQRTAMADGQDYLTVTFPRAFGGTTNGDGSYTYAGLTYRVEWSGDLVNWSGAGVAIVVSGPAAGSPAGYRLVMARSPVALPMQPRQFLRVVVGTN